MKKVSSVAASLFEGFHEGDLEEGFLYWETFFFFFFFFLEPKDIKSTSLGAI
jgi:hypothetical protein